MVHTNHSYNSKQQLVAYKLLSSNLFLCNPILFAICTSTFSKLCKQRIKQDVEGRSVALLCK
jgi:hypothetical protein